MPTPQELREAYKNLKEEFQFDAKTGLYLPK